MDFHIFIPEGIAVKKMPKRSRSVAPSVLIAVLGLTLPGLSAQAGEYASITEVGIKFYNATATPSLTGSMGYFVNLRAEKRKGVVRPQIAAEIEFALGTTRFSDTDTPAFSLYGGGFLGGFNVFFFKDAPYMPFVGANGIASWDMLKLTGQKVGVEANTQGLAFGYELSAGCDIHKNQDRAFRVRTAYWQTSSTLAGASGFLLSGWRFTIGWAF